MYTLREWLLERYTKSTFLKQLQNVHADLLQPT